MVVGGGGLDLGMSKGTRRTLVPIRKKKGLSGGWEGRGMKWEAMSMGGGDDADCGNFAWG